MKHCLRFCLIPLFFLFPFLSLYKKAENIDNSIKDIKVSYVQIAANHGREMWP